MPDKGWSTPDMFVPPGYHMGASISGTTKAEKEEGDVPYTYAPASGLGYVMMNGCWGKNYTASDPCYNAKWTSSVCQVRYHGYKGRKGVGKFPISAYRLLPVFVSLFHFETLENGTNSTLYKSHFL